MNTHNHESVAEEGGVPLLKAAFGPLMNNPRLGAFYLGNWIADLSQVIDPVAGATGSDKIKALLDDTFDMVLDGLYFLHSKKILPYGQWTKYDSLVRKIESELLTHTTVYMNSFISPGVNEPSPWFKAAQPGVLLKGYFKFVHPKRKGDPPRMDLGAYLAVFDALFKQYYPHEHVDRPPHPCPMAVTPATGATQYDDRLASGPRSNQTSSQSLDLYAYLRDDIEMVAGCLADLDLNWASKFLRTPGSQGLTDTNVEWNLGLARLGYALHAVEDFYAHSNFVEHAAKVMGEAYLPEKYQWIDNSRLLKRLKRYDFRSMPDDWRKNADETHVVTGYFDFVDTLNSLSHIAEDGLLGVLEWEPRDVTRDLRTVKDRFVDVEGTDEDIEKLANKVVRDFLEVIDDPSKLNIENKDNSLVATIQWVVENSFLGDIDKFITAVQTPSTDVKTFEPLLARMPLFQDIYALSPKYAKPEHTARILKALFDYARAITITIKFGQMTISLYQATRTALEFSASPMLWLRKALPEKLAEIVRNYALYYGKVGFYYAIGGERIGCHSLLSKDHGDEFMFDKMKDCATAAHYHIVQTMMRWRQPASQSWVDWLDLLEHFTNHPAADVMCTGVVERAVETAHPLTQQERSRGLEQILKDLTTLYQPVAFQPTGLPFDHKTIFHANCSQRVKRSRNVAVAEDLIARVAFPQLVVPLRLRRIIIPYLKHQVVVCDPSEVSPRWYMPVMKDGWEAIKTKNTHVLKFHPDQSGALARKSRGETLRQLWEDFYRPGLKARPDICARQ